MTGSTLSIGGQARSEVPWVSPRDLDARSGPFREILVSADDPNIGDEWSFFRAVHSLCLPGSVVTAVGGSPAVESVLRLAGFTILRSDGSSGQRRVRARADEVAARICTCSIVVPCRNELENIWPLVQRAPSLGSWSEIVFVDGASSDGTPERVEQVATEFPDRNIRLVRQSGSRGKAGAVFQGFDAARGDVLIILDADMTVPPGYLDRFYLALSEDRARFANGTRFAYPMAAGAMPRANHLGNRAFSAVLGWVTGEPLSDTLCGTKALFRADWARLRQIRPLFGEHDPWGDFDLLLGAAYLGLDLVEVPVPYGARMAGESKMNALRDGPVLLRSSLHGVLRLKLRRSRQAARQT